MFDGIDAVLGTDLDTCRKALTQPKGRSVGCWEASTLSAAIVCASADAIRKTLGVAVVHSEYNSERGLGKTYDHKGRTHQPEDSP